MAVQEIKWHKLELPEKLHPSQIKKGALVQVQYKNKKYCLGKNNAGWFAIPDKCPHAGASLSKGQLIEEKIVVCPLHRICFDITNGKNTSGEGYGMESFQVKKEDAFLYIALPDKKWYQFWK